MCKLTKVHAKRPTIHEPKASAKRSVASPKGMSHLRRLVMITVIVILRVSNVAYAELLITATDQSAIQHKQTLIITGSAFGIKEPAAPLWWDDCEDKTVDNYNAVKSEAYLGKVQTVFISYCFYSV